MMTAISLRLPKIVADADTAMRQLINSTDCTHSYFTYRAMERPGPHPADFVTLCKDGGMFAPKTLEDQLAAQMAATPPPRTVPASGATSATNAPSAAESYAAKMSPVPKPSLIGADEEEEVTDKRKVKYWITMSLPTYWTKPPTDAKPEEVYFYRPDFYQDEDGIGRRVTLWFNPQTRTTLKELLGSNSPTMTPGSTSSNAQAIPAKPVRSTFSSPLDDSYRSASNSHPTNAPSSKNPQAPAPAGLANGTVPAGTNTAPEMP